MKFKAVFFLLVKKTLKRYGHILRPVQVKKDKKKVRLGRIYTKYYPSRTFLLKRMRKTIRIKSWLKYRIFFPYMSNLKLEFKFKYLESKSIWQSWERRQRFAHSRHKSKVRLKARYVHGNKFENSYLRKYRCHRKT